VRRAGSGRPRAHRRRPRPAVWVVGRVVGGLRCRQLKPACARPSSAGHSRLLPSYSRSLPTSRSPLTSGAPSCSRTTPPVLTALILGSAPKLPGCKRLHLTFSPSWRSRPLGREKTQILSELTHLLGCSIYPTTVGTRAATTHTRPLNPANKGNYKPKHGRGVR